MNRKEFFQNSIILGSAAILPLNNAFSQNVMEGGLDKITDENGNFVQAPLPYSESFLEPHMDEETLHLHYTYHHGGAVKGANKDLAKIRAALDHDDFALSDYWTKKMAHHVSSHVLHSIFWTNLTNHKTEPTGELLKRIEKNFGTYDRLQGLLANISKTVTGSGWGILGYQPYSDQLVVLQCENHEKLTQWGVVPLLVIDVWEHAYYLKYKNKRGDFVDTLFSIFNWGNVAERLDTALKLR
ncbi:MAG: superoxide dismutase [Bacteroidetes bacterium]|nr:MAG: superoxide dismutase [Bacteroidota bacterium]